MKCKVKDLIIYGLGPFAEQMHFYFTHDSPYNVIAFTADAQYLDLNTFCGLPAIPFERVMEKHPPDRVEMFVAIGYRRMRDRPLLFSKAKASGYRLASYISSHVLRFPDLHIGENNVALANVHIEPFVRIGNNNALMSGALVAHGASIADGNFLAARCLVGANCVLDDGCFLGSGAVLIDGLRIQRETHIVAGSTVFRDTKEFHRYMGNPAKEIGQHEEHGIVIERV
jgi:sugar O-acyltransferase (sialic acid O-acetyltransferase NeuD family)